MSLFTKLRIASIGIFWLATGACPASNEIDRRKYEELIDDFLSLVPAPEAPPAMSVHERFDGKGLERELSYAVKTCDETGLPHAVCADDYTAGGYNVNRPSRFYEFVRAKIGEMSNDAAVESIEPGDKPGYRYTVIHVRLGDAHLSCFIQNRNRLPINSANSA